MKVAWKGGVSIQHGKVEILFDPINNCHSSTTVFISHGHFDHSTAFKMHRTLKFSSSETMQIASVFGAKIENWHPLRMHKKVAIDNVEIIPRNAGHVIGSYEFEVNTPEGNILFTGDINTEYTKTMEPAETLECDILVLEATFGSPNFIFPSEEVVAEDMVNWARRVIKMGKFPAFQTDPLGNAQEVIRIFNESNIPVITHWKVTRISDIYKSHGYNLEYLDAKSEDAEEVIRSGNFVLVTPKNFDLRNRPEYVPALVSGWALWARRKAFPLSDHADFPRLVKFVEECRPKIALTCHGERFDEIFARYIEKKLKIRAYPIHLIPTSLKSKH